MEHGLERQHGDRLPEASELTGLWAAVPTPMTDSGDIDYAGIQSNARHFTEALQLEGIFCNGLMGEIWSLTIAERRRIVETVVDASAGKLRIGVVTSLPSLRETIDLSQHAQNAGAHHVVLTRPAGPFGDDEIIDFIAEVAANVDLPIVLFNAPGCPGSYGAGVLERLSDIPSVIGIKSTIGVEDTAEIRERCGEKVVVSDPLEENWLLNLLRYDQTSLYADPEPYLYQTASAQPIRAYFDAWRGGSSDEALRLQKQLEAVRRVYNRWIMTPLRQGRAPNAALKSWCELMGMAGGGVRYPLRPLALAQKAALRADLESAGLLPDPAWTTQ